ncbi:MAG: hypothetical protein JWO81_2779 [Alphaproteobacteria bacterium]|nr:hypothetical protein [Alphaproteobacteria bacterium]
MRIVTSAALLLGFCALAAASAQDWSDNKDEISSGYAESKAICRGVRNREPPAADRPDARTAAALKGCDSEALYYGIGVKADPVRARQCAFLEMQKAPDEGVFAGPTMLMTIYANGVGAKRDLDVAAHLACGLDGAPAETDGRVRHLAELKAKGWTGRDFDYCNDITSGLAMGYCASHEADMAKPIRDAKIARLTGGWSTNEKQAFAALQRAHAAFVEAHGSGEVDMSGTARGAMEIAAEETARDEFAELLQNFVAGRMPAVSHARFAAADARLNQAYRKALAEAGPDSGTVTKEAIRDAQRAWLRYRDAFLAFAAIKFPSASRDSLAAWLTDKRTRMLEGVD